MACQRITSSASAYCIYVGKPAAQRLRPISTSGTIPHQTIKLKATCCLGQTASASWPMYSGRPAGPTDLVVHTGLCVTGRNELPRGRRVLHGAHLELEGAPEFEGVPLTRYSRGLSGRELQRSRSLGSLEVGRRSSSGQRRAKHRGRRHRSSGEARVRDRCNPRRDEQEQHRTTRRVHLALGNCHALHPPGRLAYRPSGKHTNRAGLRLEPSQRPA